MPGRFNVANALGALAAVHALGADLDTSIAGVVNIILKNDFNGAEAHVYGGAYDNPGTGLDGTTQVYDFTIGKSDEHSGIMLSAQFQNKDGVLAQDRYDRARHGEGAADVDGKEAPPQIIGHVLDLEMLVVVIVSHGVHAECGVVDENVHGSEPLGDGSHLATALLCV